MTEEIQAGQRVKVVGRGHPHKGETGIFTGAFIRLNDDEPEMLRITLDNCQHLTGSCFAERGALRLIEPEPARQVGYGTWEKSLPPVRQGPPAPPPPPAYTDPSTPLGDRN